MKAFPETEAFKNAAKLVASNPHYDSSREPQEFKVCDVACSRTSRDPKAHPDLGLNPTTSHERAGGARHTFWHNVEQHSRVTKLWRVTTLHDNFF